MKHTEQFDLDALLVHYRDNHDDFATDDVKLIQEGAWVSKYKGDCRTDVYQHTPTGRYFAVHSTRRGSYWTDYEYADTAINEVFPHRVTRTEYLAAVKVSA